MEEPCVCSRFECLHSSADSARAISDPPALDGGVCARHSVRADSVRPHYIKNYRPGDSTACSGGLGGGPENKNAPEGASLLVFWRTGRDSNPRWDIIPNTLSRRAKQEKIDSKNNVMID